MKSTPICNEMHRPPGAWRRGKSPYRYLLAITLLLAIGFTLAADPVPPGAPPSQTDPIAGTWRVQVQFDPEIDIQGHVDFSSFTSDGRLINVGPQAAGVGEWARSSESQYAITFYAYTATEEGPAWFTVRSTITLNDAADEFTGPFRTDFYDLSGNPLFSVTGTVLARRLQLEPL